MQTEWNAASLLTCITSICSDVLGIPVRPEDNFFGLGVSSIEVASVRAKMVSRLAVDIPLGVVLESASIASLCADVLPLVNMPNAELVTIRARTERKILFIDNNERLTEG